MAVLPSTGASRYHNCCVDGGTSPENFGSTHVFGEGKQSNLFFYWNFGYLLPII
jgi:hypothetical protein